MKKYWYFLLRICILTLIVISDSAADSPVLTLNRNELFFGLTPHPDPAKQSGTPSQTFTISNTGTGTLHWRISASAKWLEVSPAFGQNTGIVTVSADEEQVPDSMTTATVDIEAEGAANSPQELHVTATLIQNNAPPFGEITRSGGFSILSGNIPITGWALDDKGVQSVKIYRYPQAGEGSDLVYIGDAVFVEGARPDIQQAYPGYPLNYQAGWSGTLYSHLLPRDGNGMYEIIIKASDTDGVTKQLGVWPITCDNSHAVKPFGAIDTPAPGGTASGKNFINWGWVLTPLPNHIPTDGSTIDVFVDGVNVGHPTFNIYRQDIADIYPEYANSDGAMGYYSLNTESYKNGVHTIEWLAKDNAGNTDGIGSRYFSIINSDGTAVQNIDKSSLVYGSRGGSLKKKAQSILNPSGAITSPQTVSVENIGGAILHWQAAVSVPWILLSPTVGTQGDKMTVSVDPSGLAAGYYTGTIKISDSTASLSPQKVMVTLDVDLQNRPPIGEISRPVDHASVSGTIPVTGWALDDVEVDSVFIYMDNSGVLTQVGFALPIAGARPDKSLEYSYYPKSDQAGWGYMLSTHFLPGGGNGAYTIIAVAQDVQGKKSVLGSRIINVDNSHSHKPFGRIDFPFYGATLSPDNCQMHGWALTPAPNAIPINGSTMQIYLDGQLIGSPQYNIFRQELADLFPKLKNAKGAAWQFSVDVKKYTEGLHSLVWEVTDDGSNFSRFQQYVVISHQTCTGVNHERPYALAINHELFPAYPNPFNGSMQIDFLLKEKADVQVTVYDLLGRRVRQLVSGLRLAGRHTVTWQGEDGGGLAAASGAYFVVMRAGRIQQRQKIVLLR